MTWLIIHLLLTTLNNFYIIMKRYNPGCPEEKANHRAKYILELFTNSLIFPLVFSQTTRSWVSWQAKWSTCIQRVRWNVTAMSTASPWQSLVNWHITLSYSSSRCYHAMVSSWDPLHLAPSTSTIVPMTCSSYMCSPDRRWIWVEEFKGCTEHAYCDTVDTFTVFLVYSQFTYWFLCDMSRGLSFF